IPEGSPVPKSWYGHPGLARGIEYTPDFWHGQWVPHALGTSCGCRIVWRRILPWPSTAGREPVTLDALAEAVPAKRDTARDRRAPHLPRIPRSAPSSPAWTRRPPQRLDPGVCPILVEKD